MSRGIHEGAQRDSYCPFTCPPSSCGSEPGSGGWPRTPSSDWEPGLPFLPQKSGPWPVSSLSCRSEVSSQRCWGRAEGQLSWVWHRPQTLSSPPGAPTRQIDSAAHACAHTHTRTHTGELPCSHGNSQQRQQLRTQLGSCSPSLVPIGHSELGVQRGSEEDPLHGSPGSLELRQEPSSHTHYTHTAHTTPHTRPGGVTPPPGPRKPHQLGTNQSSTRPPAFISPAARRGPVVSRGPAGGLAPGTWRERLEAERRSQQRW